MDLFSKKLMKIYGNNVRGETKLYIYNITKAIKGNNKQDKNSIKRGEDNLNTGF
jgi:hypothetical protein